MQKHGHYGEHWIIATLLLDGALSFSEIKKQLKNSAKKFGFYGFLSRRKDQEFRNWLESRLKDMEEAEWLNREEDKYRLTKLGRQEAEKARDESLFSLHYIKGRILTEQFSAKLTLIIHFVLAAIKLPIGLLSGSVSLINDSLDTLLDGISGVLVFIGIKKNFEKQVSAILCFMMLITGSLALYTSVKKIFVPYQNNIDIWSFLAIIVSIFVSLFLMYFQRFVGIRRESFAIVTQSFDSQNHVLIGFGVLISLVFSRAGIIWPDLMIGILVALLIIKAGFELALDLIRSARGQEFDFTRYRPRFLALHNRFEIKQLRNWLLVFIDHHRELNKAELINKAVTAMDFENNITLKYLGINTPGNLPEKIKKALQNLKEKGLIREKESVKLTEKGQIKLQKILHPGKSTIIFRPGNIISKVLKVIIAFIFFLGLKWLGNIIIDFLGIASYQDLGISFSILDWDMSLLSLILQLGSFGLFATGFMLLGKIINNHRHILKRNQTRTPELIDWGLYSKYRHPMYGSFILLQSGIFLSFPTQWSFALALILTLITIANGLLEEKFVMMKKVKDKYQQYKSRVTRLYLPVILWLIMIFLYILHGLHIL